MSQIRRAVFFDKDGVINALVDRGEHFFLAGKRERLTAPWTPEEMRIFEPVRGVVHAVRARGYLAIVITNQPDVSYGVMELASLKTILQTVRSLGFDDLYACLHGRDEGCRCRKPMPGMLLMASSEWNIDLERSYFLGDTEADTIAARAAGCTSVIIDREYNAQVQANARITRHDELLDLLP